MGVCLIRIILWHFLSSHKWGIFLKKISKCFALTSAIFEVQEGSNVVEVHTTHAKWFLYAAARGKPLNGFLRATGSDNKNTSVIFFGIISCNTVFFPTATPGKAETQCGSELRHYLKKLYAADALTNISYAASAGPTGSPPLNFLQKMKVRGKEVEKHPR